MSAQTPSERAVVPGEASGLAVVFVSSKLPGNILRCSGDWSVRAMSYSNYVHDCILVCHVTSPSPTLSLWLSLSLCLSLSFSLFLSLSLSLSLSLPPPVCPT